MTCLEEDLCLVWQRDNTKTRESILADQIAQNVLECPSFRLYEPGNEVCGNLCQSVMSGSLTLRDT